MGQEDHRDDLHDTHLPGTAIPVVCYQMIGVSYFFMTSQR